MADYFATTQMSSALSSLATRLTGKVGEVGLYPVLKKATSSSEQPTPGYVYQVRCRRLSLSPPVLVLVIRRV